MLVGHICAMAQLCKKIGIVIADMCVCVVFMPKHMGAGGFASQCGIRVV